MRDLYEQEDEHTVEAVEAAKELSKQIVLVTMLLKSGGEQNRELLRSNGGFEFFLQRLESSKVSQGTDNDATD